MEIVVDDRERAVIPHMEEWSSKTHIDYKVQRNEVGDYAITYRGYILLVIERKTWEDLSASFRDGRKANVEKLKELRTRTGCQIAYLIEGNATPPFDKKFGRLPLKNLRAHLDHLAFRDGIHMIYSKDEEYTAGRLFELAANYLTLKEAISEIDELCSKKDERDVALTEPKAPFEPHDEDSKKDERDVALTEPKAPFEPLDEDSKVEKEKEKDSKEGGNVDQLKAKMNTAVSINEQLLRCMPSVGSIISAMLSENQITLYKLYHQQYTANDIAVMKYSGGSMIGLEKANKIAGLYKIINSKSAVNIKVHAKILMCVPLISKKTAEVILDTVPLADIFNGVATVDVLAAIQKTEKVKLGKKAAENIIKLLVEKDDDAE